MAYETEVECEKCYKILKHSRGLRRHVCPTAPLGERVKCTICNRSLKNKHSLYTHRSRYHVKKLNKDELVDDSAKDEKNSMTSEEVSDERVKCEICSRSFANKYSLYNHRSRYHAKKIYEDKLANLVKDETDPKTSEDKSSQTTAIPPLDDDFSQVKPKTRGPGLSLRENFKAKMFESMWGCIKNETSFPYSLLDAYLIKNKFFRDINEFFDFKLKTILNEREQALVNAMWEIESLEESKNILNENLDILVGIFTKTSECAINNCAL